MQKASEAAKAAMACFLTQICHSLKRPQTMWSFLKLQPKNTCTKEDVTILKEHLDIIRQAMVQKTAGQRDTDPDTYVDFVEIGTYINFVVIEALQLRIYGGLDALEEVLPGE